MQCRHCGYQNDSGVDYCARCGKKLPKRMVRNRFPYLLTALILAVGVLSGVLLFGGKEKPAAQPSDERLQTVEVVATMQETSPKPDPLVLAYSERPYDAPAQYFYNQEGQLVRKVQEQWDQVTDYEYHTNGARKKETVIRNSSTYYVTEFDDHGNPLAEYSAGELVYSYVNEYDSHGRLAMCTKTAGSERKGIYQYTYDENGWYEQDYTYITIWNGEESVHDQVWRRYSPEGVLVHESWLVKDSLPISIGTIYTLDDHGNVEMVSYQYWSDTEREREDTYYEHTYNAKGLVTKTEVSYCGFYMSLEHMDDPNSGYVKDVTLKEIITYTYDSEGRMTEKNVQNVEDNFTIENVWEYDEAGNLIRFYGVPDDETSWYVEEIWQYKPLSEVLYAN